MEQAGRQLEQMSTYCLGLLQNNTPGSETNPEYVGYYIPASIMTATGNLWVRFQWTDANDGVAYGWQIDDVVIYSGPSNDLDLDRAYMYGVTDSAAYQKYTEIPEIQAEGATFRPAALVIANGSATQSDVVVFCFRIKHWIH